MTNPVQRLAIQMSRFLNALANTQDRVEESENKIADLEASVEALKSAVVTLQPKFDTYLMTFQNFDEAETAWALVNMCLYPKRYPTHDMVPPMPWSRANIAPWDPEPQMTPTPTKSISLERKYQDEI